MRPRTSPYRRCVARFATEFLICVPASQAGTIHPWEFPGDIPTDITLLPMTSTLGAGNDEITRCDKRLTVKGGISNV